MNRDTMQEASRVRVRERATAVCMRLAIGNVQAATPPLLAYACQWPHLTSTILPHSMHACCRVHILRLDSLLVANELGGLLKMPLAI